MIEIIDHMELERIKEQIEYTKPSDRLVYIKCTENVQETMRELKRQGYTEVVYNVGKRSIGAIPPKL